MQDQQTTDGNIVIVNVKSQECPDTIRDQWNPLMCLFCVLFKLNSMLIYLLFKQFSDLYLVPFLIVLVLGCCDFWVVKNLSGKTLVGLRWWCNINDLGEEQWVYESCNTNRITNSINQYFFFTGIIINILFWITICLINLVTLDLFWMSLAAFNMGLGMLNFIGFMKCRGTHQTRFNIIKSKLGFRSNDINI